VSTFIVSNKNRQWRLKTKKAQPTAAHYSFSPPENPWLALRTAIKNAALSGDQFLESQFMVDFYNQARTHFMQRN